MRSFDVHSSWFNHVSLQNWNSYRSSAGKGTHQASVRWQRTTFRLATYRFYCEHFASYLFPNLCYSGGYFMINVRLLFPNRYKYASCVVVNRNNMIWYDKWPLCRESTVTLEINWIYNHNDRYLTRATTHKHIYNAIITLYSIDKTAQQPNYSRLRAICVRFEWIEQNTIPTMSHHLFHLNVRMTKTKTKKNTNQSNSISINNIQN